MVAGRHLCLGLQVSSHPQDVGSIHARVLSRYHQDLRWKGGTQLYDRLHNPVLASCGAEQAECPMATESCACGRLHAGCIGMHQ